MFRFKAFSEVIPAGGLYPALPGISTQTVVCIHDDVTDGDIGG
jgi:hypothetical protein